MKRFVVDTNVPIVANGRRDPSRGTRDPSPPCRLAAIEFLTAVLKSGRIVLDVGGDIQAEYRRHLEPRGQPGVGDRFYLEVLNSAPRRIERVDLPKLPDGAYADFPSDPALDRFDRSDRKFAALARRERIPVSSATDSDWHDFHVPLKANGVDVNFVCGTSTKEWFAK